LLRSGQWAWDANVETSASCSATSPSQSADLPEMARTVEEDQADFMSAERYHGRS